MSEVTEDSPSPSRLEVSDLWWGEHELEVGQVGRFKVGPLTVWLERRAAEWRLATVNSGDREDGEVVIECPADQALLPSSASVERMAIDHPGGRVRVLPAPADRLVVTRPEGTFRVLAGAEVIFYVSTPLWLRLESLDGVARQLFEAAVIRPSDTWFGPTTRHGEIAYASRTPSCLDPTELPQLPFRAITRVELHNRATDVLELLRFALPAPNLSLYFDRARPQLGLWTSAVSVERRNDRDLAQIEVRRHAPRDLDQPERVSDPRSIQSGTIWSRAMSAILS